MRIIIAESISYDVTVSVSKGTCPCLLRESTESESKYISEVIDSNIEVFTKRHTKKGLKVKSKELIGEFIKEHIWLLLVDNQYLIGFSLEEPWCLDEVILNEEFLLQIKKGESSLARAIAALRQVASNLGATGITLGTLARTDKIGHEALAKQYEKLGFNIQAYALWGKP